MKRLPAPALSALLLGLLALLLFGNCGGVRWMLFSLSHKQQLQLRRIMVLDAQARRTAREQRGTARQQALTQAEAARQRRLDSLKLTYHQHRKTQHRWRKIGRQLPALIRADSLQHRADSLERLREVGRQRRADSLRQQQQ